MDADRMRRRACDMALLGAAILIGSLLIAFALFPIMDRNDWDAPQRLEYQTIATHDA